MGGKKNVVSAQMLEMSITGVWTVLRLERDTWSMVTRLRQATNEYPPHTPSWGGYPISIAGQPGGCQYRTTRLRKALGEIFPTPTSSGTDTTPPVEILTMENRPREGVIYSGVLYGAKYV